jgi:hypothetical protein
VPADLRDAFLDSGTVLNKVSIGGTEGVGPRLADLRWGDTNLAVVNWEKVDKLSDEHHAETFEDYEAAVRANCQLAVALRGQGMVEIADRFAYRGQVLQRNVYWRQRQTGRCLLWLFSWVIAGYGYGLVWTLGWYVGVIFVCALLYYLLRDQGISLADAFIGSVTAFHGRGLFQTELNDWQGAVASVEAFFGLIIEIAFIVTFTQRFFSR